MRCELSEKLIPLYIGGDLEQAESDGLRLHLENCAACSRVAGEFQASQSWFAAAPLPDFDEASFANMRASVLSQIERRQSFRKWFELLLPKWNPRMMLAASAVALAVATGLMIAVYREQTIPAQNGEETFANNSEKAEGSAGNKNSSPPTGNGGNGTATGRVSTATVRERANPRSQQRESNRAATESIELPPEAFQNDPFGQPNNELQQVEDSIVAEAEPKEMLRMEIQTADPNIRIIWLTPKTSGSPSGKNRTESH